MHKLDNHGPFTHRRGDTFYALSSDVADGENSGNDGFEQLGKPVQRPAVLNLGAGLDVARCIECETTREAIPCWDRRRSSSTSRRGRKQKNLTRRKHLRWLMGYEFELLVREHEIFFVILDPCDRSFCIDADARSVEIVGTSLSRVVMDF